MTKQILLKINRNVLILVTGFKKHVNNMEEDNYINDAKVTEINTCP